MEKAPHGAINLALGELGYPMPEALKEQAIQILRDGNPVYTPNAGLPELRESIACDYGSGVTAEQICVCNGAEEALFLSLLALLNPGDTIAIPDPDYTAYPALAKILEANVLRLPFMRDFGGINWTIWEDILKSGVKMVLLSAPSNPSGFCFSALEARQFADICTRYGVIVIVDEIYARLYFSLPAPSLRSYIPQLICIGGLSKSHCMSGWRLGWVMAPAHIAPAIIKARQYVSTCSHWLSQKLAIYALSPVGLQQAELIRRQLSASRKLCLAHFSQALPQGISAYHAPEAGPYIMLKADDDLIYADSLAKRGLITVPGRAFGHSAKGWIRLNIGVEQTLLSESLIRLYATGDN